MDINKILNIWDSLQLVEEERQMKKNSFLFCIKSISENKEDLSQKRDILAKDLVSLTDDFYLNLDKLGYILKGIGNINEKIPFELLSNAMYNKVPKGDLNKLKEIYKSFSNEIFEDTKQNRELNRVGKKYSVYFNQICREN